MNDKNKTEGKKVHNSNLSTRQGETNISLDKWANTEEGKSVLAHIDLSKVGIYDTIDGLSNDPSSSDLVLSDTEITKMISQFESFDSAEKMERMRKHELDAGLDCQNNHLAIYNAFAIVTDEKATLAKKITYALMKKRDVEKALDWGKKEGEFEFPNMGGRDRGRRHYCKSPFSYGRALGELAQQVSDSPMLVKKIHEVVRDITNDKGREINLSGIVGAYVKIGDLEVARDIINNEIEEYEKPLADAMVHLAIGLARRDDEGDLLEAFRIIDNLPEEARNMSFCRALGVMGEKITIELGLPYTVRLFSHISDNLSAEIMGRMAERLRQKGYHAEGNEMDEFLSAFNIRFNL